MAHIRPYLPAKVFIDNIEMSDADVSLELNSYDVRTIKENESNVKATIKTPYGTFVFKASAYEQDNGELHFYGPLRSMFPDLFKDKLLLDWQVAYLEEYGMPELDKYKLYRNDSIFDTAQAYNFKRGFIYAKEHK